MAVSYRVLRSSRRTIALEVRSDGSVLVRAPQKLSQRAIEEFVRSREAWLRDKLKKYESRPALPRLTEGELEEMKKQAKADLSVRAAKFALLVGVSYGRVTIRAQKSRWGSCSGAGNLNFNCLIVLAPTEVRDYVVIHELCHRKEMNHSPRFWAEVEKICPDHSRHRRWLKDNGGALIARLPE